MRATHKRHPASVQGLLLQHPLHTELPAWGTPGEAGCPAFPPWGYPQEYRVPQDRVLGPYLHITHVLCAHVARQGGHAVLAEAQRATVIHCGWEQCQSPSSPCLGPTAGAVPPSSPSPLASLTQQHSEAHAAERCRVQHPPGREDGVGTPCERQRGVTLPSRGRGMVAGGKLLPWGITTRGCFWAAEPSLGRSRMASKSRPPAEAGWGVSGLGGGGGAQPGPPGHSLYWGCSCSGGGCRVRMPQLMPGTGGASCRQTHCACASQPPPGRMATFCAGIRIGAGTERVWWVLGRGVLPYQRRGAARGGEPGHQDVPVNGEDRPASLGSIWGGGWGQTSRRDPLPSPGTGMAPPAWHSPAVSEVVAPVTVSTTNTS